MNGFRDGVKYYTTGTVEIFPGRGDGMQALHTAQRRLQARPGGMFKDGRDYSGAGLHAGARMPGEAGRAGILRGQAAA